MDVSRSEGQPIDTHMAIHFHLFVVTNASCTFGEQYVFAMTPSSFPHCARGDHV
jgi:hypothetical protein